MYFRKNDEFSQFKKKGLKDYISYRRILLKFQNFLGLEDFTLKQLDKYLWQLGKYYFRKNYILIVD